MLRLACSCSAEQRAHNAQQATACGTLRHPGRKPPSDNHRPLLHPGPTALLFHVHLRHQRGSAPVAHARRLQVCGG